MAEPFKSTKEMIAWRKSKRLRLGEDASIRLDSALGDLHLSLRIPGGAKATMTILGEKKKFVAELALDRNDLNALAKFIFKRMPSVGEF